MCTVHFVAFVDDQMRAIRYTVLDAIKVIFHRQKSIRKNFEWHFLVGDKTIDLGASFAEMLAL